ncbi:MAG: exosome complex exonuclease Rrp41 [archaeon]|nr:exosome complex exonuclease Rrp41 [archaeon]
MTKKERPDNRKLDEIRPMKMKAGVIKRADGSAQVEFGLTKVVAAVYGPRQIHPRHQEDATKSVLRCRYNMLPFSVSDRKRQGYDRRSTELAKVITEALEPALFLEEFPKTAIDVDMEIVQADAGTRAAAINAASLAIADAGIPMRDLVTSVAAGRANKELLLDMTKEEEDAEDAVDVPMAMMPRTGKITLLQMDGIVTPEDTEKIISLAEVGCKKIYEAQKKALLEKYSS